MDVKRLELLSPEGINRPNSQFFLQFGIIPTLL
nr:MAG TPA: hypothetical protein [Caudoviricetes sp.]